MHVKNFIIFLVIAFIISGCINENENITTGNTSSEYNYTFAGSSESWEASYEIDITDKKQGETQRDEEGTLQFIGDGEAPELIDYKIVLENGVDSSEGTGAPIYDNVGNFSQVSCGNCVPPINEDEPIEDDAELELEIMWNDKSEKMTLTLND